jgi:hypothetical protein
MVKLTVNPKVKAALRQAFPKPPASAARMLDKYVGVLQDLINDALLQPRPPLMRKGGIYVIPVSKLQQTGQIGPQRIRLHKWLENNGYSLIKQEVTGTNLSGENSWVTLTSWVTLEDEIVSASAARELTDTEIDAYLTGEEEDDLALFNKLYPDHEQYTSPEKLLKVFDVVEVDVASLQNYITWLLTESTKLSSTNRELYVRQAKTILAVSNCLGGKYLQRKKRSEFGRTYYAGLSVQNVTKDLRRAMLGNCWEYDVRSSVVAWKMSWAPSYLKEMGLGKDIKRHFSATLWLLADKAEMFAQIQERTFLADSNVSNKYQIDLIKEAMTALCFGARLQLHGWRSAETDGWQNPALVDIIKNEDERKRFVACRDVKDFVAEQNALDTYMYKNFQINYPNLCKEPFLLVNNVLNKSKVVAYLYQNNETFAMNFAYEYLKQKKISVLAKIHDAFVVRKQLPIEMRQELVEYVQEKTFNEFWKLGEKKLERWGDLLSQERKQEIAEHKKFITNEVEYMRAKLGR